MRTGGTDYPDPNVPPPPPYTDSSGFGTTSNPFFYTTMSISELRAFLTTRGVASGDILDKETLCQRAWETHIDCISLAELNKFLADQQINTAGCRDVLEKRKKAKEAFQPPNRPARPPASKDTSTIRYKKDDTVVLTGLQRQEMNGKRGQITSVDEAAGRATILLDDGTGKSFKIKFDNLELANDEYIEELD